MSRSLPLLVLAAGVAAALLRGQEAAPPEPGPGLDPRLERLGSGEPGQAEVALRELLADREGAATAIVGYLEAQLEWHGKPDWRRSAACLRGLAALGRHGARGFDVALRVLCESTDYTLRRAAMNALARIAPWCGDRRNAVTEVVEVLASDQLLQRTAERVLLCATIDARAPTTAIVASLAKAHSAGDTNRDRIERIVLAEAVAERMAAGEFPPADVEALTRAVRNALAGFAALDQGAMLERMLEPWDERTREHATLLRALAVLAPHDPQSLLGHRLLLRDPDPGKQTAAARHLGLYAEHGKAAVIDLTTALSLGGPAAREAATALGILGTVDAAVLQALRNATASTDAQLVARARAALRRLER